MTDGTACVGGNVLSFARKFPQVNAVELSAQRAEMLKHNVSVAGVDSVKALVYKTNTALVPLTTYRTLASTLC